MQSIRSIERKYGVSISDPDQFIIKYSHIYRSCGFVIKHNLRNGNTSLNKRKLKFKNFSQIECIYLTDKELRKLLFPIIIEIISILKHCTIEVLRSYGCKYVGDIKEYLHKDKQNFINQIKSVIHKRSLKTLCIIMNKDVDDLLNSRCWKKEIRISVACDHMEMSIFGDFLKNLRTSVSNDILRRGNISVHIKDVSNCVFILKDLRNAIAHDKLIFDCRFRRNENVVSEISETAMQIRNFYSISNTNFDFDSIIDYFILLIYYQRTFHVNSIFIRKEIHKMQDILYRFKRIEGNNIFNITFRNASLKNLKNIVSKIK